MKSQVQQPRFPTFRTGVLAASVALAALALGSAPLRAQGGAPAEPALDPLCRCYVGGDSTVLRDGGRDHRWAFAGALGLALLAGLPIGGGGTPAIPFVEAPPGSAGPLPPAAEVAGAPPAAATPGLPAGAGPLAAGPAATPAAIEPLPDVPVPPLAFVPPRTATHLPLLAAAGVLLMGAGGLLARRQARRQRRRRRRVVAI